MITPFHLAIPVHDLSAARRFYGELLGCAEGRSDALWVDFNLYGHQLVCHFAGRDYRAANHANPVDGESVPIPHFGVVLSMPEWQRLRDKLEVANIEFIIPPTVRFAGEVGEQATLFLLDQSGNALEFKAFRDWHTQLFER